MLEEDDTITDFSDSLMISKSKYLINSPDGAAITSTNFTALPLSNEPCRLTDYLPALNAMIFNDSTTTGYKKWKKKT